MGAGYFGGLYFGQYAAFVATAAEPTPVRQPLWFPGRTARPEPPKPPAVHLAPLVVIAPSPYVRASLAVDSPSWGAGFSAALDRLQVGAWEAAPVLREVPRDTTLQPIRVVVGTPLVRASYQVEIGEGLIAAVMVLDMEDF